MTTRRVISVLAYILWVLGLSFYNVALWGPSPFTVKIPGLYTYVVRLSANDTQDAAVTLDLGFRGLCAFRGVDERDAEMRFCLYDFNFGDEPSELYKTFHDDTDMEDSSDPLPKETLTDLLSLGRVLRTNVIPYNDAVAAMVLLCIGGLVVLFPVFFNNPSKRKVCGALMALSALILGYGIMTAGSLVFTTWRVQNLANAFLSGASPIVISFGNVKLQSGSRLWICLVVALVMNAAFIFLITLSAFIRNIFPLSENKPKKPKKVKAQKFQAKGIRGIKIKGRKGGRW